MSTLLIRKTQRFNFVMNPIEYSTNLFRTNSLEVTMSMILWHSGDFANFHSSTNSLSVVINDVVYRIYPNGTLVGGPYNTPEHRRVFVRPGDIIAYEVFAYYMASISGTIYVRSSGPDGPLVAVIPYENLSGSSCYLTTSMVHYFGYADNGPELTAMRLLRKEKGNEYPELLQDYNIHSRNIIAFIDASPNKDTWYNAIKETVMQVTSLVQAGDFNTAAILYADFYNNLKSQIL